jgi:hypothetical protein
MHSDDSIRRGGFRHESFLARFLMRSLRSFLEAFPDSSAGNNLWSPKSSVSRAQRRASSRERGNLWVGFFLYETAHSTAAILEAGL